MAARWISSGIAPQVFGWTDAMDCEELGRFWFEHGVPTCTGRRFAFGVPSGFANRRVRDGVSGNVKMTPQQHLKIDPLG